MSVRPKSLFNIWCEYFQTTFIVLLCSIMISGILYYIGFLAWQVLPVFYIASKTHPLVWQIPTILFMVFAIIPAVLTYIEHKKRRKELIEKTPLLCDKDVVSAVKNCEQHLKYYVFTFIPENHIIKMMQRSFPKLNNLQLIEVINQLRNPEI